MRQPATMTPTARKMLAWELIEHGAPAMLGRFRGLGDVCVVTAGGSRVCSADATATSGSLAQTNPNAVSRAARWSANMQIPSFFQNGGISNGLYINPGIPLPGGSAQPMPSVTGVLAQAQAIYNQNPAALTQNQWALLQSAGIIPSTLPYSSASSLPAAQSAAAAAATTPATTDIMLGTFDLTQFVESVPWWGWALGAGGVFLLWRGGGKGRR